MAAQALGWDPQFYLMMPSNCRFVQCGVEVHIAQVQLSFGKYEVCHQIHPPRNAKGAKAYTTAVVLGPLAQHKPNCWVLCGNVGGDNPGSVVAILATLFGLLPWRNATHHSGEEYNAASAVDWVHRVLLPSHTVVVQRHEGAFFPSVVLESLAEFLAETKVYFGREDFSGRGSSNSSEPLHNSKGLGLRTLHETSVAAEEFVLSTWAINKFPGLVPGERNDQKTRDVTTFLISGRSTEATSGDINNARKRGYYSAKRLIFSSKAASDVRGNNCRTLFLILSAIHQQFTPPVLSLAFFFSLSPPLPPPTNTNTPGGPPECPISPLGKFIDDVWKSDDVYESNYLVDEKTLSSVADVAAGWGPCCPTVDASNISHPLVQESRVLTRQCRRCVLPHDKTPIRMDRPPEQSICGHVPLI